MSDSNGDNGSIPPEEQARADRLSDALDRLLAGQRADQDDPLFDVATQLASLPVGPSTAAQARFEQQLTGWFSRSAPSTLRPTPSTGLIRVIVILLIIGIIVGILIGMVLRVPHFNPSTATPSVTSTPSMTVTLTVTALPTATATDLPTLAVVSLPPTRPRITLPPILASATAIPFARVVISGQINNISGSQIIVFGQPIHLDGGISGLCINDLVVIEALAAADGTLHAARSTVTVQVRGCISAPVAPVVTSAPPNPGKSDGAPPNPGKSSGDDDHHHHDD